MRRKKLMHFSHHHPLREFKVKEEDGTICAACELDLSGPAFKCNDSGCNFFLHKSCLELPEQILHRSHTTHFLTLLSSPANYADEFTCNACAETGSAFTYHCSTCDYDLHVKCASLPETVNREDHEHPIRLHYSIQNNMHDIEIVCDLCDDSVKDGCWVYRCAYCDFGTHLNCATLKSKEAKKDEEGEKVGNSGSGDPVAAAHALVDEQMRATLEMRRMQLELQATHYQAEMIREMGMGVLRLA